jgi:predicted nicotinamide N-methyase
MSFGFALARLLAHCPSLVQDCHVLELGCGLGLVSTACITHSSPIRVVLTDRDEAVLDHAYSSCLEVAAEAATATTTTTTTKTTQVSKFPMDWTDSTAWPRTRFDVVLAADVLYDRESIPSLVKVLHHYLLLVGGNDAAPFLSNPNEENSLAHVNDVHNNNNSNNNVKL